MTAFEFNPRVTTPEGIVAIGGQFDEPLLIEAYRCGVFPWPQADTPLLWFSPNPRGVLDFSELHVSRSLAKFQRKNPWRITHNQAFEKVMRGCRDQIRPGQTGTWILDEMIPVYTRLHQQRFAESWECWDGDQLVGGIYGVMSERYFSAESMFYQKSNASKLCLLAMVESLKSRGFAWVDVQMVTEASQSFGAKLIHREDFLRRIGI